ACTPCSLKSSVNLIGVGAWAAAGSAMASARVASSAAMRKRIMGLSSGRSVLLYASKQAPRQRAFDTLGRADACPTGHLPLAAAATACVLITAARRID